MLRITVTSLALVATLAAQQAGNTQRNYTINGVGDLAASYVPSSAAVGGSVLNDYRTSSAVAPAMWIASANGNVGWQTTASNSVDIGPQNLIFLVNAFNPADPFSGVFFTDATGRLVWTAPVPTSLNGAAYYFATAHGTPSSPDGYFVSQTHLVTFIPDPNLQTGNATCGMGATALSLGDDATAQVALTGGFNFYGTMHTQAFVGSNGFVTFLQPDTSYQETVGGFLAGSPRISALWDDLSPNSGGTVSFRAAAPTFEICWSNVPEYPNAGANTFKITLSAAQITFDYGALTCTDALVGLSPGANLGAGFPINLSAAPNLMNFSTAVHAPYQIFTPGQLDLVTRRVSWLLNAAGRPITQL